MNFKKTVIATMILGSALLGACSSSPSSNENPPSYSEDEALAMMEAGNLNNAHIAFGEIINNGSPSDLSRFAYSTLTITDLLYQEEVQAFFTNFGDLFQIGAISTSENSLPIFTTVPLTPEITSSSRQQEFSTELVDVLENQILPALEQAANQLQVLYDKESVINFPISALGNPQSDERIELDKGDFGILISGLNAVQAVINISIGYDFTISSGNYSDGVDAILANNPQYGLLRNEGANLANAHAQLLQFHSTFVGAYTYLINETDDQSNDGVLLSHIESSDTFNRSNFLLSLEDIEDILTESRDTTFKDFNGNNPYTVKVNLQAFLNSPPPSLRPLLSLKSDFQYAPQYNVDFGYYTYVPTGNITEDEFPDDFDYTIGGLFPELTTYDDWESRQFLFSEELVNGINNTYTYSESATSQLLTFIFSSISDSILNR